MRASEAEEVFCVEKESSASPDATCRVAADSGWPATCSSAGEVDWDYKLPALGQAVDAHYHERD